MKHLTFTQRFSEIVGLQRTLNSTKISILLKQKITFLGRFLKIYFAFIDLRKERKWAFSEDV